HVMKSPWCATSHGHVASTCWRMVATSAGSQVAAPARAPRSVVTIRATVRVVRVMSDLYRPRLDAVNAILRRSDFAAWEETCSCPRVTDVLIVGSGPGGVNAAAPLVAAGRRVVMVDFGNEDRHYAPLIPHESFSTLRRTDATQHRYLLGDRF